MLLIMCNTRSCSRLLLLAVFFFASIGSLKAQSQDYYTYLYYLCKVWGHGKYFHSEVAAGNVDWDDKLLAAVAQVKNADSDVEFNIAVRTLLASAGEPQTGDGELSEVVDSLNNNRDLSWIQDEIFDEETSALLDTIWARFRPMSNVYISGGRIFPRFFDDAKFYDVGSYPAEEYRILAAFRFWNIIHYFFPYKDIMDAHWDSVLIECLPKIVEAEDALSYHLAMREFTAQINDTHAGFLSAVFNQWQGNYNPPFLARWIENEMVITRVVPWVDEVGAGDVIRQIDGVDMPILRDSLRRYAHGSNAVAIEYILNSIVSRGEFGSFSMAVENEHGTQTVSLQRSPVNNDFLNLDDGPSWTVSCEENCQIAIVNMGRLERNEVDSMFTKSDVGESSVIIFDIRNYPNSTFLNIADHLFPDEIWMANFTAADYSQPGRLYWSPSVVGYGTSTPWEGHIILLFDERSISQAEFTCMGFEQYPSVTKIGSTTLAADGNTSWIGLPGQISVWASFLGVFYPDYTPTQRVGILPDIEVRPTIQGIREGRDEVLEFALNYARSLCGNEDTCIIAGTKDSVSRRTLRIFPNPAREWVYFELPPNGFTEDHLRIFDAAGRVMKTRPMHSVAGEIDISDLPAGIYTIELRNQTLLHTGRFVKID